MNEKLTKEEIMAALNERHSPEKQALLSEGRVAIAGLGGLGSNVAYALARIGVGHLHLIDFDVVDITNLNRQQYFMEHLGMYKTDALKSLLLKINPYLDIQTDCVKVTEENIVDLLRDDPIICEAFDRAEAKAMLVNGNCNVLKEHCHKSNNAALYYTNEKSFIDKLHMLDSSTNLRLEMGEKGYSYVNSNYDWNIIMNKLKHVIENI